MLCLLVALAYASEKVIGIDERLLFLDYRPTSAFRVVVFLAWLDEPIDYKVSAFVDSESFSC